MGISRGRGRIVILAVAGGLFAVPFLLTSAPARAQTASAAANAGQACIGGFAGTYPCNNVDLLSHVTRSALGVREGSLNDVWGWTDPQSGKEYALVGLSSGTGFVDVSNPEAPLILGTMPTQTTPSLWRDIKVFGNHAVVVSEATDHGMQIFDLTQLRSVEVTPTTFSPTSVYTGVGSAHNVFVNEASGYAYAVGSRGGTQNCGPGLHIVDIRTPDAPTYAGCFAHAGTGRAGNGYSHDVQCVIYEGPDADYAGREICFGSNENAVSIADVTDKSAPVAISSATYPIAQNSYIHQGWLTEDHRYFLQDDELDERNGLVLATTTRIWDVSDLDAPFLLTTYEGPTNTIDHNLYVRGSWAYLANYRGGLRVIDLSDILNIREIAFFDTYPVNDGLGFDGAWSNYPFFESGSVLISSIGEGLFVVRPPLNETSSEEGVELEERIAVEVFPNPTVDFAVVTVRAQEPDDVTIRVFDVLGRAVAEVGPVRLARGFTRNVTVDLSGLPSGRYILRANSASASVVQLLTVIG